MQTRIVLHNENAGVFYGQLERKGEIVESYYFTHASPDVLLWEVVCDWCVDHGLTRGERDQAIQTLRAERDRLKELLD